MKGEAPAQLSKENVLYIMDKTSLAGQPHSLEIILEATSRDKTKTQWFVIGQSVPYFTSCFTPTMAGAVPGLDDRCFDTQPRGTWLASKQRGAAGELPR